MQHNRWKVRNAMGGKFVMYHMQCTGWKISSARDGIFTGTDENRNKEKQSWKKGEIKQSVKKIQRNRNGKLCNALGNGKMQRTSDGKKAMQQDCKRCDTTHGR